MFQQLKEFCLLVSSVVVSGIAENIIGGLYRVETPTKCSFCESVCQVSLYLIQVTWVPSQQ